MRNLIKSGIALIAIGISGCNSSGQQQSGTISAISGGSSGAGKFHACNYDGSAYDGANLNTMNATAEGEAVVAQILAFTGLPQNFKVQEGEVPNAAAVILQEPDGALARYILYNREFMKMVDDRTKNNWAGISILAHEIGHHLSGHTLLTGGSQPAIELEADKFSGYVLYKMGAGLNEAQIAMNTLVPDEDGDTHPGRPKRLNAILDGWNQACKQSKGDCNSTQGTSGTSNGENVLANSNPQKSTENMIPDLPEPGAKEIPLKFDRFVYDEADVFSAQQEQEFSDKLKEVTMASGAEIVILCPKSLGGMSLKAYAYAMMEKMRIGKMDLANGGVFIFSEGQLGFVIQPGLYWVMGPQLMQSTLDDMITAGNEAEQGENAYQAFRYGIAAIEVHINTGVNKWKMDYPTLAAAKKDGENAVRKITRAIGKITDADTGLYVGDDITRMKFTTDDGEEVYIHVMKAIHSNLPSNARMAIVGRLFDMKYATVMEVLSVEPMQ